MCQTKIYGEVHMKTKKSKQCVYTKTVQRKLAKKNIKLWWEKREKKTQKTWHMHRRFLMYAMSFSYSLQPLML